MGVELFRDTRAILVESIFWDDRTDEVVWVDITAGTLHRGPLDGAVDGSDDRVVRLPAPMSAVQPAADGGFVVALKNRIALLDADGRIVEYLARVPHAHDGIRCNEGMVDPYGRFIVGGMDVTTEDPDAGLYAVDRDGSLRVLRGGFGVANGFEWSDDGATMYVTDTSVKTVYRAPYSRDGELGELEPFLVGHDSDGLALAADGSFFNAVYGGGVVLRFSPDGAQIDEHRVPAPNLTSVAFVGPDLATLLVGSARENLSEEQLVQHPLSGALFRVDVTVPGRAVPTFGIDPKEN